MYQPEAEIVPPVADQVSVGSVVLPSFHVAATANCWLAPPLSVTGFGVTESDVNVRTLTVTLAVSANDPLDAMTRYVPAVLPAV